MSDSHTGFDSRTFTGGALTGAGFVAAGMVGALQAAANANERAWADWDRVRLEAALTLSELLKNHAIERAETAETELMSSSVSQ